jgi:coenzyme F420 biosynthesis associated uncharacterized protein
MSGTETNVSTSGRYVDWELAKSTGARLVAPGPRVSKAEAAEIVADLRAAAAYARDPVAATAQLTSPDTRPALVVDRASWVGANVETFAAVMDPVVDKLERHASGPDVVRAFGAKVSGAEAGSLLAFLASRVLGQYDLAPHGVPRLMLVAPNIVEAERQLGVDPGDFRRWVAMHEETHRVQFTAVPWLREHLLAVMADLAMSLAPTPDELSSRLADAAKNVREALTSGGQGLAEIFLSPEHKAKVAQATAVMSLLEGHADVVMDEVGPAVIPTVDVIRARFTERRKGRGGLDRLVRRLLGLEAKMAQYVEGARFVRAVTDVVGVDGFNAVWTSPETLPTPDEIAAPGVWVGRVHG